MPNESASADERRVAVVTGACSGIGREIARRLGARGHELVLVSERPAGLAAVADEIRATHGGIVHTLAIDLARPEAAEELHQAVRALALDVDVLVINAGMFFFGEAADAEPAKANALLQLHVVTPSLLCTRFGRDMRTRRRGRILIVSSISAWRDFPGISYYGTSKKYLRGFARALRAELAPYGVSVTCLAPGATDTGLYDPGTMPVERARRLRMLMEAGAVADAGLRALFAGKAECVPGLANRAMTVVAVLTPEWLIGLIRRHAPWLPKPDPSG